MSNDIKETLHIQEMYEDYFLEYASYVITDRAVPYLDDGLKPVQRRILHSLFELDDGRFHKAANVIGNTMKYHPHGDAAIRDALVNLAQKELLIETQGNWGDPITGDAAAAPRYVECKLSKFALEVAFNRKTTQWQNSYDGRNREPVVLPVKFPLLLTQGAEGIAVGLATKIMPHNFIELIQACIKILKKEDFQIFPDFLTGGTADISNYNDGKQGGKVKVRATIETTKKKALIIREVPYGTTTGSLIESIISANNKGKIKIKRIEDNTAKNVEIVVYLPPGTDPDKTIDALYAFTDCEVTLSPNCCVIRGKHPKFVGVSEMLRENVKDTVALLKQELLIRQAELEELWHMRSLERIFIEERIYRKIEKCQTWESILKTIRKGLEPFTKTFIREVTDDDITHLTEIRIKRISAFDAKRAQEELISLEKALAEVKRNLRNLTSVTINYYENILKKYGKGKERRTKIDTIESISVSEVILSNLKVFYDKKAGFVGTSVRADKYIGDCSKLDDILIFTEDGSMVVTRVSEKTYVGKNIIYAAKFEKNNQHIIFNMIYRDGRMGPVYLKRFAVGGITRDKQYILSKSKENSKVFHLSISPRETSEIAKVILVPKPRIKKEFEVKFNDYDVKGRGSGGNIITKYAVRRVKTIEAPAIPVAPANGSLPEQPTMMPRADKSNSTTPPDTRKEVAAKGLPSKPKGKPVFWDTKNNLVGFSVKGTKICYLEEGDWLLLLYDDGSYITYKAADTLEIGDGILYIDRWSSDTIFSAVYVDGKTSNVHGKRFQITSLTDEKYFYFISDYEESRLLFFTASQTPTVDILFKAKRGAGAKPQTVFLDEKSVPVRKVSHLGTVLTDREVKTVKMSKKNQLSLL